LLCFVRISPDPAGPTFPPRQYPDRRINAKRLFLLYRGPVVTADTVVVKDA
jgi:hypothetical protein